MRKIIALAVCIMILASLVGCGASTKNSPSIVIGGETYYETSKVTMIESFDESLLHTGSFTVDSGKGDGSTYTATQYAVIEDGTAVVEINEVWYYFKK